MKLVTYTCQKQQKILSWIHLFLLHCRTQRKELVSPKSSVCQKGFNIEEINEIYQHCLDF